MKNYFFSRNLLSSQVSCAISENMNGDSVYLIESPDDKYFQNISSVYPEGCTVLEFHPVLIPRMSKFCSFFLFFVNLLKFSLKYELRYSRVFVTYPVHLPQSLYLKIFRFFGAEVHFFEEGSCFYKFNSALEEKRFINSTKIKSLLIRVLDLDAGYRAVPDVWHSILDLYRERNATKVNLTYEKIDVSNIRRLFLSRPLGEDFGVEFDIYVSAIRKFAKETKDFGGPLYIKFHPRESHEHRLRVLNELSNCGIVESLDISMAAENLVYNMTGRSVIGGFETATLVYSNAINDSVRIISMLRHVKDYDLSGVLSEYYDDYSSKYNWIEFL